MTAPFPSRLASPRDVVAIAATPIAIPFTRPLELATGAAREHCAVVVELCDREGGRGWGEIAPGPATTRAEAVAIARTIAACGADVPEPPNLAAFESFLRTGFEAAALDLGARRDRQPLHRTLGSDAARPVSVNAMIDRGDPDTVWRAATAAIADGFRCLKIKAAPESLADLEVVLRRIRESHGDAVALRVDCNGQWSLAEARSALRRLAPFDLEYVEQPVATLAALGALRGVTSVRIAADESAVDATQIDRAIATRAVDVLVLKPARLGPVACLRAAAAARAAGIDCVVSSNLETSLGLATALHVAACIDARWADRPVAHGLGTIPLLGDDLTEPSLLPRAGILEVPAATGSGVTPLAARIERWRIA